jgi:hypothetical protein
VEFSQRPITRWVEWNKFRHTSSKRRYAAQSKKVSAIELVRQVNKFRG